MTVDTKAYGVIEVDSRQKITLPAGLFGFEDLKDFVLIDSRQRPFYWLQSLDLKDIAFVLIEPRIFRPDYEPRLHPEDFKAMDLDGEDDANLLLFTIVTVPKDSQSMTANLQGPLVINKENRVGRQCISQDDRWKVRHAIFEEMAANRKEN